MSDAAVAAPSTNGKPALEIDGLYKRFGGIHAINGAEFAVREGSITALIGPNGAGKTTLFNVVTGFYRPESGAILYRGDSIFGKRPHAIAQQGMVRTFQITKALAAMPVIDNMMLAGPNQPGERLLGLLTQPRSARRRERELEEHAHELLRTFNLEDKAEPLRGDPLGRAAQAARAGARADDRARDGPARRADGRHQPDAGPPPARAHRSSCAPRRASRSCSSSTTWTSS